MLSCNTGSHSCHGNSAGKEEIIKLKAYTYSFIDVRDIYTVSDDESRRLSCILFNKDVKLFFLTQPLAYTYCVHLFVYFMGYYGNKSSDL